MSRRFSTILLATSAIIMFWSGDARACSCVLPGAPCQAVWEADAVFAGTVRAGEDVPHAEYPTLLVRFHVEQGFVNISQGSLDVVTPGYESACGYRFQIGRRYLVYAHGAGAQLTTGICTRTRRLEDAAEDLRYLTNIPPAAAGVRVSGRITQWERDPAEPHHVDHGPLAGILVNVRAGASSVDVRTDRHGRYEVTGLPVGPATVTVLAPHGFNQQDLVRELELKDPRGCGQHDFQLRFSAQTSGLVVDVSGRPVADVEIDAVAAELAAHQPPPYQRRVKTGADGRFLFDDLPPGRYVFGINLTRDRPDRSRGTPVFAPGTTDVRQASLFELSPGDVIEAGVLRVPEP